VNKKWGELNMTKSTNNNKKVSYSKSAVSKKIKLLVMPACIGLALVLFLITFVMLTVISDYSSSYLYNIQNRVRGLSVTFIVISFIMSSAAAGLTAMLIIKTLHKHISKPLIELVFNIKKINDGFEELGIEMTADTEDEIALIKSVYFKVAEQLKEHVIDVRELSGLTERFENSAHYDSLTGVFNRRRFTELVQKHIIVAAKKNEPTFVFMLDLDHFKNVNDTYGHDAGDEVLKVIANRIKDSMRPYDLFGRYGGEEFIMFMSANEPEIAVNFAERVREIVQDTPVHFDGIDIPVTTSVGVAQAAPDVSFDKAIKLADKALYKAKKGGRNRVELYS
jgi:diguanylate cyclase (GGDEF)-like protein